MFSYRFFKKYRQIESKTSESSDTRKGLNCSRKGVAEGIDRRDDALARFPRESDRPTMGLIENVISAVY